MKIAKFIPLLILPLALTACGTNEYTEGKFFSSSYLKSRDVPGLEKAPGNLLLYTNIFGYQVYTDADNMSLMDYSSYVYEYLKKQNFAVLGSVSKRDNLTKFIFKECSDNIANYLYDENSLYFVYSKDNKTKKNDDGEEVLSNANCLSITAREGSVSYTVNDAAKTFEYTGIMQFHTSVYIIMK